VSQREREVRTGHRRPRYHRTQRQTERDRPCTRPSISAPHTSSQAHTHTHFLTCTHTNTFSQAHTHTHFLTSTQTLSLSLSHCLSHTLSHSLSHSHCLTYSSVSLTSNACMRKESDWKASTPRARHFSRRHAKCRKAGCSAAAAYTSPSAPVPVPVPVPVRVRVRVRVRMSVPLY
jgi:hypothetical protein